MKKITDAGDNLCPKNFLYNYGHIIRCGDISLPVFYSEYVGNLPSTGTFLSRMFVYMKDCLALQIRYYEFLYYGTR